MSEELHDSVVRNSLQSIEFSVDTLTLGEPLTASVLGVLVLGEHLSPLALLGLGVLASGLVLLALGSRAPRQPAPFAVEG